jgi:hypothetical protein
MPPPDPSSDPAFAALLRGAAERLEASLRAQGVTIPPAVFEQFWKVAIGYLRDHPLSKPNTFYNFSGSRLVAIVRDLEHELPNGYDNPAFNDIFERRLRDVMEERGSGAS